MSEPVIEIRFALGWLKFYFVLTSFGILILVFMAILNLSSFHPGALLFYTIPLFIVLFSLRYKMKNRTPRIVFSENGIEMTSGLKRFGLRDDITLTKPNDKLFVSWTSIRDAEFITSRGSAAIALDTDEDEAWRATRAVIPIFAGTAFRKYVFDVRNLELEPVQLVSMIKQLTKTPPAERKNVLLQFSKNLV